MYNLFEQIMFFTLYDINKLFKVHTHIIGQKVYDVYTHTLIAVNMKFLNNMHPKHTYTL